MAATTPEGELDVAHRDTFNRPLALIGAALHAQMAIWTMVGCIAYPSSLAQDASAWATPRPYMWLTFTWLVVALVAVGIAISGNRTVTLVALSVAFVVCAVHVGQLSAYLAWLMGEFILPEPVALILLGIGLLGVALPATENLVRSPIILAAIVAGLTGPLGMWLGAAARERIDRTGEKGKVASTSATILGTLWFIAALVIVVVVHLGVAMFDELGF